jgi:hypothetical protein
MTSGAQTERRGEGWLVRGLFAVSLTGRPQQDSRKYDRSQKEVPPIDVGMLVGGEKLGAVRPHRPLFLFIPNFVPVVSAVLTVPSLLTAASATRRTDR